MYIYIYIYIDTYIYIYIYIYIHITRLPYYPIMAILYDILLYDI